MSTLPSSILNSPASALDTNNMSPTRRSWRFALRSVISRKRRCCSVSLPASRPAAGPCSDDRRQRRAELMRDGCEELIFRTVGLSS